MVQLNTDNIIEDMYNCPKKKSVLLVTKSFLQRFFLCTATFIFLCTSLFAANITNSQNLSDWISTNTLIYTDAFDTNNVITLTADTEIQNLFIRTKNKTLTIDLAGYTLTINTRIRLGQTETGHLIFINGTVITKEFDTNDDGQNSLFLDNVTLTVTDTLLANGLGITTIDGDGTSAFIIPSAYNMSWAEAGDGNVLYFPNPSLQPTTRSGTFTITTDIPPSPGKTVRITIVNEDASTNPATPLALDEITCEAIVSGTGETYILKRTDIVPQLTENISTSRDITLYNTPADPGDPPNNTIIIDITIPESVVNSHGIELVLYKESTKNTKLGTPVFYSQQSTTTTWTGAGTGADSEKWEKASNWNYGVPATGMNVLIPARYPDNATGTTITAFPVIAVTTNEIGTFETKAGASITINSGAELLVTKNINSNCNISGDGKLVVKGTDNQTFTARNYNYSNVEINKNNGTLSISGNCKPANFTITKGKTTTFSGKPVITNFKDTAQAGAIAFNNGGTITSLDSNIFLTTSLVSFGDADADTMNIGSSPSFADLEHTAGQTAVTGTLNAANMTFGVASTSGTAIIKASSLSVGNLTSTDTLTVETTAAQNYNGTVSAETLYLAKATTVNFTKAAQITSLKDAATTGDLTFNDGAAISAVDSDTLLTTGTVTFGDAATDFTTLGTNPAFANLTHSAGPTVINGTLNAADLTLDTTSITGTLNGTEISLGTTILTGTINGTKLSLGNTSGGAMTINATTKLLGDFEADDTVSFTKKVLLCPGVNSVFGKAGKEINIADNLIIFHSAALTINASVNTAKNLVFYKGTITVKADLSSGEDLIILGGWGSTYSTEDESTGITNEYAYDAPRPSLWSEPSYNETTLPDGTAVPVSGFNATLVVDSGKVFHAGKNFYANGTSLTGSAEWFIDILSNADSQVCFAEAYNSTISHCTVRRHTGTAAAGTEDSDNAQIPAENCTLNNCKNFDSTPFTITDAWTTRDSVVYVKFNREVRNKHGELNNAISNFTYYNTADNDTNYSSICTNPDGTGPLINGTERPDIYLLAQSGKNWNTDATGKSSGTANSTDRNGNHKSAKPYIDIPRALGSSSLTATQNAVLTDRFGKRLSHYSGTSRITTVLDKTGPVLIQVRTGQETHETSLNTQKAFDSHNFIEFIYSEAVNFGLAANASDPSKKNTLNWIPAFTTNTSGSANMPQNIQISDSTDTLGHLNSTTDLFFAGLNQKIASGKIHTKKQATDTQNVNALYRDSIYSIKYSVAGYASNVDTNGTITGSYIIWPGYIEDSVIPSGSVTGTATVASPNLNVTDCALAADDTTPLYNPQIMNKDSLSVDSSEMAGTNYGSWDTQAPVFVKGHLKGNNSEESYYEAIGNGNGSTITKIEIHISDNPSSLASWNKIWLTRYGWAVSTNPTNSLSPAADNLIGGARPYAVTNNTSGAIRYCTLLNQQNAFKYEIGASNSTTKSFTAIDSGASAPFFTSSTSNRNEIPVFKDNTYINLTISDNNLPYKTTFTVSYDETNSYITDLAGNRLKSQALMKTIDRTSPDFKISFTPVNSNKLLLIFVKGLTTQIKYNQTEIPESFETIIPYCFELGTINNGLFTANSANGELQIDSAKPARIIREKSNNLYTVIELTLTQKTSYEDIKKLYIRLKNAGNTGSNNYLPTSKDPLTGIENSYVTFIQDSIGNYMQMYQAHALSDFAAGIVNPLYAYNDEIEFADENLTQNLYKNGSWAVHDWDQEQKNYGTLLANRLVSVVTSVDTDSLNANASGDPDFTIRMYYSLKPDSGSQSNKFNADLPENKIRLWMPTMDISDGFKDNGLFSAYSSVTNSTFTIKDGEIIKPKDISKGFSFNFNSLEVKSFNPGEQISFIFGILDATGSVHESICLSPVLSFSAGNASYSTNDKTPLFCIRLKNKTDLTSMDLWSIKFRNTNDQRGGVTVLNNVINASEGEKVAIKVNMPANGKLNVIVMTLDGNIVTYLNHGETSSGEHYFTWNGKNKNGKPVARGMYFIRVAGNGIDETRKVMVIK